MEVQRELVSLSDAQMSRNRVLGLPLIDPRYTILMDKISALIERLGYGETWDRQQSNTPKSGSDRR